MSIPINLNLISSNFSNYITNVNLDKINANKISKTGGSSGQYLMADGSTTNTSDITSSISTVSAGLAAELTDRAAATTVLASNISTVSAGLAAEFTTRSTADTTLTNNINTFSANLSNCIYTTTVNTISNVNKWIGRSSSNENNNSWKSVCWAKELGLLVSVT